MAQALDPRLVQVGIQIGQDITYFDQDFFITATGTKYGNNTANECQVRISNLTRAHRDSILRETSPWLQDRPKQEPILIVNAGRQSYGASQLFIGRINDSQATQPPDIGIILNAVSGFDQALNTISVSMPAQTPLSTIAQAAAKVNNTTLNFQATDKNIANYSYTGTPLQHITKIQQTGNVNAFIDNNSLVVTDKNVPLKDRVTVISQETGMIGTPEVTALGIRVKYLLDNTTSLLGSLKLTSILNPALNGNYVIQKLSFDIASRDTPFYWIAECGFIV